MKTTDYFKTTIQNYLQHRAQTDELFAPVYAKENKNIDDCITYILNYVQQSGIAGYTDDEIYSLALHYYDTDGIEAGKRIECNVVVNHTIVLTDEEKAEARQRAIQRVQDEAYAKMKQSAKKQKPTDTDSQQSSLF